MAPFASLKKQVETLFRLICCERKILFRLKKTDYKISEQGLNPASGGTLLGFVSLEPDSLRPRAADFGAAAAARVGTMKLPPTLLLAEIRCLYMSPSSLTAFFSLLQLRLPQCVHVE